MSVIAAERPARETVDSAYTFPFGLAAEVLGCQEEDVLRLVRYSELNLAESGVAWPLVVERGGVTWASLFAYRSACRPAVATSPSA